MACQTIVGGGRKKVTPGQFIFPCGDKMLNLYERTHIMGILNITPDSFFDGGKYVHKDQAIEHALKMIDDGADVIDIGGESTRPGSDNVSVANEIKRVIPVIEGLRNETDVPLSIDTQKAVVAEAAIQSGADIVNDVSGLRFDKNMGRVVSDNNAGLIVMHMQGTPRTMQKNPVYQNLIREIVEYLEKGIRIALESGISREKIMIDPGIGFGKKWEDNYIILNQLSELDILGFPILIGVSRKSFIGKLLDLPQDKRLIGTASANAIAILHGAHMIRVHDVYEMAQVAKIVDQIKSEC